MTGLPLTGGCQCGAVRYAAHGWPRAMLRCHCTDCQRQSASAFGLSVYFEPGAVTFEGDLAHFDSAAESGRIGRRYFCPRCGVRLLHARHPDAEVHSIKGGTLDPGHGLAPVADLWTRSKLPWVPLLEGGLAWETQPPSFAAVIARFARARTLGFYDAEAPSYAEAAEGWVAIPRLEAFAARLPRGGEVLDLGCGTGWAAAAFRDRGFRVEATDGSAGLAAEARRRHGIAVRLADFRDLDAEAAFDGIWAHFSLLHAPRADWPDLLGRIRRALKPGGWLFLGLKEGSLEGPDALGRHYTHFTAPGLRVILTQAGFDGIEIEEGPGGPGYDGVCHGDLHATARRGD